MPTGLSVRQLLQVPFILRTISRMHAPGSTMTQYYGLGATPRVNVQRIIGNAGQYDIFDGTRSLAPFTAPFSPPLDMNRKPIGTQPITVPRQYNKIGIYDNDLFGTRNQGAGYAQPSATRGEQYFANQVRYLKTRMNNNHEFMTTQMFAGGWKLKPINNQGSQQYVLGKFSDTPVPGEIINNTLVPAENKGDVNGIFNVPWTDPTANIVHQMMELQVQAARVNGRRITDIWVNGNTGKYLFTNSVIQGVGGAVNRIYDTLNLSQEIGFEQKFPDTGVTVVFGGLPEYRFHIYNQGYVKPGTSEAFDQQISSTNWQPFIPDGIAIMTPPPGDWVDMVEGSELVQWNLRQGTSQMVMGLGAGTERAIDPPRTDVKCLYNGAPTPVEPNALYYVTVFDPT